MICLLSNRKLRMSDHYAQIREDYTQVVFTNFTIISIQIVKSGKGKCTYDNLRFEEFFFHVCNFRMIMHFEKSTSVDYRAQVSRLYIELGRHMVCASLTQKFLNLLEQLKKALSSFHSFKISWCVSGSKFNEQIGKSSANR